MSRSSFHNTQKSENYQNQQKYIEHDNQLEDLQESLGRNLQNLEQVVSLLTGTLPSLCDNSLALLKCISERDRKIRDLSTSNSDMSLKMNSQITQLRSQVLHYQNKFNLKEQSPIIEENEDQEMECQEESCDKAAADLVFSNQGFSNAAKKNEVVQDQSQNQSSQRVSKELRLNESSQNKPDDYETFFDIPESSLAQQQNQKDEKVPIQNNSSMSVVQSWMTKKDGQVDKGFSEENRNIVNLRQLAKKPLRKVEGDDDTTGSQKSVNLDNAIIESKIISDLTENKIDQNESKGNLTMLIKDIQEEELSSKNHIVQDEDTHQLLRNSDNDELARDSIKQNLMTRLNAKGFSQNDQVQEDSNELDFKLEAVNKESLEDTKAARNSNLLKSKAQNRADAASRYREKHDNLQTEGSYLKNKSKVKKVKIVEKVDALDDLLDQSKQGNQIEEKGSLGAQFKRNKDNAKGGETKIRETVRDRDKRRQMKGQACFRCQRFYEVLDLDDAKKQAEEICNECSRHRDNEPINNTPEQFYDLDI